MADERPRAIELALAQIEKQFGKGSIMRLGNKEAIVPIAVIPTGSISFDAGQDHDRSAGDRRGQ